MNYPFKLFLSNFWLNQCESCRWSESSGMSPKCRYMESTKQYIEELKQENLQNSFGTTMYICYAYKEK